MNPEIQEKLAKLSEDLIESVKSGAEWTTNQAGLLFKEIVYYHIAEHICYLFIGIMMTAALVFVGALLKKASKNQENSSDREMLGILKNVCFILSVIPIIAFSAVNVPEILKGIYAPRLVLIEKLQEIRK